MVEVASDNTGVSIEWLLMFATKENLWNVPTRIVRSDFILPAIKAYIQQEQAQSIVTAAATTTTTFVQLPVVQQRRNTTGKSATYVCHTLDAPFGSLVCALCDGGADLNRKVWIDIFSAPLLPAVGHDEPPGFNFRDVIHSCSSFVQVCFLSSTEEFESTTNRQSFSVTSPLNWRYMAEVYVAITAGTVPIIVKSGRHVKVRDLTGVDSYKFQNANHVVNSLVDELILPLSEYNSPQAIAEASKFPCITAPFAQQTVELTRAAMKDLLHATSIAPHTAKCAVLQCAACGDLEPMQELIEDGLSSSGLYAAAYGFASVLKALILKGFNINSINREKETALMFAAGGGHKHCLALLLAMECDVNMQDSKDRTALMRAAQNGYFSCTHLLLASGCDVSLVDSYGRSALIWATVSGNMNCISAILASESCNVKLVDRDGANVLHHAAMHGHVDVVRHLVEPAYGFDVDVRSANFNTPLLYAAMGGHVDCMKLLIELGADLGAVDENGLTVLMAAVQNGRHYCIEFLIEKGCDPHALDDDGVNAFICAAVSGYDSCLRTLLHHGCGNMHLETADYAGMTALMWAALGGHVRCVKLLLEQGCNAAATDRSGRNAEDYAAAGNHAACIALLSTEENLFVRSAANDVQAALDDVVIRTPSVSHYSDSSTSAKTPVEVSLVGRLPAPVPVPVVKYDGVLQPVPSFYINTRSSSPRRSASSAAAFDRHCDSPDTDAAHNADSRASIIKDEEAPGKSYCYCM